MGRGIFEVGDLPAPLHSITERVMVIPRGRRLIVDNIWKKIVILLEGRARALVNDRVVGDMKEGDVLAVPGACRQTYIPLVPRREARMRVVVLAFDRGVFTSSEGLLRTVPVADPEPPSENFIRLHFGSVQLRQGAVTLAAGELIEALRGEAMEKGVGYRLRVAAHALLLLTEIARRESPSATVPAEHLSRQAWIVEQTKNFLLEHHAEELTLDQVAWNVRLSGEHLARTFRRETGQTIFGYTQHVRLEWAKAHLAGSQLTVNEIARRAGFNSASRLCRVFKGATGESPLAYRLRVAKDASFSPSLMEGTTV